MQVSDLYLFPCATQTLDVIERHGVVTDSVSLGQGGAGYPPCSLT